MHLNEFMLGNIGALLYLKKKDFKYKKLTAITSLLALILLIKFPHSSISYNNGFLGLFFALGIITLAASNSRLTYYLSNPICIKLGEISYAMYILQVPIHIICYWTFDLF